MSQNEPQIPLNTINPSISQDTTIKLFQEDANYQEMVDDFIKDHRLHDLYGWNAFFRYNFPKPNRRQIARLVRSFISFVVIILAFYYVTAGNPTVQRTLVVIGAILGGLFLPTMVLPLMIIMSILIVVGLSIGFALFSLCQWFVVLYNTGNTEPSTFVATLIILCYLVVACYTFSCLYFHHVFDPLAAFFPSCLAGTYFIVERGGNLEQITRVTPEAYIIVGYIALVLVIQWVFSILILPEHNSEDVRVHMFNIIRMTRDLISKQLNTSPGISKEYVSEIRREYAAVLYEVNLMNASVKTSPMDIGFVWDSPVEMAGVAKKLGRVTRHLGNMVESVERVLFTYHHSGGAMEAQAALLDSKTKEMLVTIGGYIDKQLIVINDCLIVHPGILGRFGWYCNDLGKPMYDGEGVVVGDGSIGNVVKASERDLTELWKRLDEITDETKELAMSFVADTRSVWLESFEKRLARFERADVATMFTLVKNSYVFGIGAMSRDTRDLATSVRAMYERRRSRGKRMFVIPFKGWPKRPKREKVKKVRSRKGWNDFWNDVLYGIHQHFESDASHYAFKRTLVMLIIAVFAFIPATATFFAQNNGYWVMITNMVVFTPTLGGTVIKMLARLVGTIVGCVWGVIGFVIFGANYLGLTLWILPLALVGIYLQTCSKQPYCGMIMIVSYSVVTLGNNDALRYAGLRSLMVFIGIILAFLGAFLIYPLLARTSARIDLGNVLFNISELFQRVTNTPLVSKEEMMKTKEFQDGDKLYESTQGLLTRTRQVTLYNAAGEPDVDRPYDQAIMEAIGASLQRLMDVLGAIFDAGIMLRQKPENLQAWSILRNCFAEDRDEFARAVTIYFNTLAECMVNKRPLPPAEISPRLVCTKLLQSLDPHRAIEETKKWNVDLNDNQVMDILFCGTWALGSFAAALTELIMLEDLMVKMLGRSQWFVGTSNDVVSWDDDNDEELGLLQKAPPSGGD